MNYVEQEAKISKTAAEGRAWIDTLSAFRVRILHTPRFQEALQAEFDRVVALPDSELGAYDLRYIDDATGAVLFGAPGVTQLVRRTAAGVVESN